VYTCTRGAVEIYNFAGFSTL